MEKLFEYVTVPDVCAEDRHAFYNMVSTIDSLSTVTSTDYNCYKQHLQLLLKDSDVKKKYEGLTFILKLTNNCTNEIFNSNAETWLRLVTPFLCLKSANLRKQCYFVIKAIFKRMANLDLKDETISKILTAILKTSEEREFIYCLECLAALMEKIPSLNKTNTIEIENLLIKRLGSRNLKEIEILASCMSRLPAMQGSKFIEFWNNLFKKIINTLRKCFIACTDFVHDDVDQSEDIDKDSCITFELPSLNNRTYSFFLQIQRFFHTISLCGAKLLNTGTCITVPGKKVLQFIDSILSFIPKLVVSTLSRDQQQLLLSILPNIKIDVLLLLEGFISSCHNSLSKYELPILTIMIKALNVSQEINPFSSCSFPRAHIYRILRTLIIRMGECAYTGQISTLMQWVMKDTSMIFNSSNELALLTNEIQNNQSGSSPCQNMIKRKNCFQALEVLSLLVLRWKKIDIKGLFWNVSKLLQFIQLQLCFPPPYDDIGCRKGIYNALSSIVSKLDLREVAYVSKAICIFESGMSDPSPEVSHLCCHASLFCHSLSNYCIKQPNTLSFTREDIPDKAMLPQASWSTFGGYIVPNMQPYEASVSTNVSESSAIKSKDSGIFDKRNGQITNSLEFQENNELPTDDHFEDDSMDDEPLDENEESEDEVKEDGEIKGEDENREEDEDEIEDEEEEEVDDDDFDGDYDEQESTLFNEVNLENHNIELQESRKPKNRGCILQNGTISTEEDDDVSNDANRKQIGVKRSAATVCNDVKKKRMEIKLDNSMDESDGSTCDLITDDIDAMMADFVDASPVSMPNDNS